MAAFASATPALAASLHISPVNLTLAAGQHATAVTLSNIGNQPIYGQVRVFRWRQEKGEDILDPSTALLASPPMIEIAPGADQLIRIVRPDKMPPSREESYRILIDEIPQAAPLDTTGVTIRMRYSVPLFVAPAGPRGRPSVQWELQRIGSGWTLRAHNTGTVHARISKASLTGANGNGPVLADGLMGYALAGKARRWNVPAGTAIPAGNSIRIRAQVNGQEQDQAVRVVPAAGRP